MKHRLLRFGALAVLVMASSACYERENLRATVLKNHDRTTILGNILDSLTVDDDPSTNPDSPQDPAYLLRQSRAICAAVEYIETITSTPSSSRPAQVVDLCPPGPDPVYPPKFPPTGWE